MGSSGDDKFVTISIASVGAKCRARHMKVSDLGLAKLIIGKTYTTCASQFCH